MVWFDAFSLEVGDSLSREIDTGLAVSEFGVVILSPHFFQKQWALRELAGLVARETSGTHDVILPIWHNVTRNEVAAFSLPLADRVAVRSSLGIDAVATRIIGAIERARLTRETPTPLVGELTKSFWGSSDAAMADSIDISQGLRRWGGKGIEWHPHVHAVLGQAVLCWFRFAFVPTYNRRMIVSTLEKALESVQAPSYQYLETLGLFDGYLKVWLPRGLMPTEFGDSLREQLVDLQLVESFRVDRILRSWIWQSRDSRALRTPSAGTLESGISATVALAVSRGVDATSTEELIRKHVVSRVARTDDDIPFIVTVGEDAASAGLSREGRHHLEMTIDAAVGINEPTLYQGVGFASALITGTVATGRFDRLVSDVAEPIKATVDGRSRTEISPQMSLYKDEPRIDTT
jgi:hypothetical protein